MNREKVYKSLIRSIIKSNLSWQAIIPAPVLMISLGTEFNWVFNRLHFYPQHYESNRNVMVWKDDKSNSNFIGRDIGKGCV